jgi:hypothetical protein
METSSVDRRGKQLRSETADLREELPRRLVSAREEVPSRATL